MTLGHGKINIPLHLLLLQWKDLDPKTFEKIGLRQHRHTEAVCHQSGDILCLLHLISNLRHPGKGSIKRINLSADRSRLVKSNMMIF